MKLAIADPPYLGRAHRNYGPGSELIAFGQGDKTTHSKRPRQTTTHPDADVWDKPERHRALVEQLIRDYDGWAIAMNASSLRDYLRWVPDDTRICSWHKPRSVPTGSRITPSWEPVLVFVPRARRARQTGHMVTDTHVAPDPHDFVGAKPSSWTRWVLDVLGFLDGDEVTDLFGGSGAVTAEINQQVIL